MLLFLLLLLVRPYWVVLLLLLDLLRVLAMSYKALLGSVAVAFAFAAVLLFTCFGFIRSCNSAGEDHPVAHFCPESGIHPARVFKNITKYLKVFGCLYALESFCCCCCFCCCWVLLLLLLLLKLLLLLLLLYKVL